MKEKFLKSELQDEFEDEFENEDPDDEVEMSVEELTRKYPKAASCWRESHCVSEEEKKHIRKRYVKLYSKGWQKWTAAFSCIGFFVGFIGDLIAEAKADSPFYTFGVVWGIVTVS